MNTGVGSPVILSDSHVDTIAKRVHYSPPWADLSIIGVAGSSGSGKSTLSHAIVSKLNLPWVVIMSMDSYYKPLDAEAHKKAFLNEYDFDSPDAIDFEALLENLRDLKAGKRTEIPTYSFEKHQRMGESTTIYSPHVLILEGIFALYDPKVTELMDMRIYCEADADTCLSRRILRDVRDRGRTVEGCIKQWFGFVKPNYEKYVVPQRNIADIIVPRGIENRVAMTMVTQYIERKLVEKSTHHRAALKSLEIGFETEPLSDRVIILEETPQLRGMNTLIQDIDTSSDDFMFYFDRLSCLLIEEALNNVHFRTHTIETPTGHRYQGLIAKGEVSAVIVLRGGAAFETGLRRVIPDCRTGRLLIQSNVRTGEPELHYLKLPKDISEHESVLLLDAQMSSGGSALMAVQVLVDHGVPQDRIVLATYSAGRAGIYRVTKVFPGITIVVVREHGTVPSISNQPQVERLGNTCEAVHLPSIGTELQSDSSAADLPGMYDDAEAVRAVVLKHLDDGHDVVLVAHSYSGIAGSEALKNLDRTSRTAVGAKTAVIHVIYIAALIVDVGQKCWTTGKPRQPEVVTVAEGRNFRDTERCVADFYNECTPEQRTFLRGCLRSSTRRAFTEVVTHTAWRHIPSTFVRAVQDLLPDIYWTHFPDGHMFGEVVAVEGDHFPFVSNPIGTAEAIDGIVKKAVASSEVSE